MMVMMAIMVMMMVMKMMTGDDVLLWLKARTSKLMDLCLSAALVFTWLNDLGQVT